MDIFPDVKQAIPLPYEKVFRLAVKQIEENYKDGWLFIKCREQNLLEIYHSFHQKGIFEFLKRPTKDSIRWPPKLTIELVPSTCWFENVRSNVNHDQWGHLKKTTYKNASYKCEVCGGKGPKWPVECHEIWNYNDETNVQKLVGLIALCPPCHEVKHIGLTQLRGKEAEAKVHLALTNKWNLETANNYINSSFDLWSKRSKKQWTLDISFLSSLGMDILNSESEPIVEEIIESLEIQNKVIQSQKEHPKIEIKKKKFIKSIFLKLWSVTPFKKTIIFTIVIVLISSLISCYIIAINELCLHNFNSEWTSSIRNYCRSSSFVIKTSRSSKKVYTTRQNNR